jgi:hypothetical protein
MNTLLGCGCFAFFRVLSRSPPDGAERPTLAHAPTLAPPSHFSKAARHFANGKACADYEEALPVASSDENESESGIGTGAEHGVCRRAPISS